MSDTKACPFCLEDIPAGAIKCRFCESMVDDIKTSKKSPPKPVQSDAAEDIPVSAVRCSHCNSIIEDINVSVSRGPKRETGRKISSGAPQQEVYYEPYADKKKGKSFMGPLIALLVILMVLSAGAVYWFLLHDDAGVASGEVAGGDIIGSWKGGSEDNEIYFQFLPNEMVNVAVTPEGYWFRTQYRLITAENQSYLELYHRGLAEWERTAELGTSNAGNLIMTDTFDGIVIVLESIIDSEFREAIAGLEFES